MVLTSKDIYNSMIHGAYTVIKNKEVLNRINVFPVRDGDTGSNLSSMMKNIIKESSLDQSIKKTLESIAESALYGARGNSGIIFAGYLSGLSESIHNIESITMEEYAVASSEAVDFAYNAIENPVEGTMITLMREWGNALVEESVKNIPTKEIFSKAFSKIELALEKTKTQLEILKKSNVVDSGAKGFSCFIEGALYYINTGEQIDEMNIRLEEDSLFDIDIHNLEEADERFRYCTECLFEGDEIDTQDIKEFLKLNGNSAVVASNKNKCRIHVHTNEPADVFDYLHQRGAILYQKVDDMVKQKTVIENQRSKIALITDSIADLPKGLIDEYQIHMVHLDILFEDRMYMDKLTVKNKRILELADQSPVLPTSSQPSPKKIESLFDYLSTYYDSAIVMTVSKELSGTYNSFKQVAKKFNDKDFKISLINTKQNSAAEGLLVKACAELIEKGRSHDQIVEEVRSLIQDSKILVKVQNLNNMIKSGRLSVRAGKVGKYVGLKPIVTLDKAGKGSLDSIAFSKKGSNKKIIKHLRTITKNRKIGEYSIVHIDNRSGADQLADLMKDLVGFEPSYIDETSSIVALGAGRGAVAISYLLEKEGE